MLLFIKSILYFVLHPFDVIRLTIVRRYVDAMGNFIGELYEGIGPYSRMIGVSCDNWPLDADTRPLPGFPSLDWTKGFLEPLPKNTLRVGALEPQDNAKVQAYIAIRRFCPIRVEVRNRFVEHVLERKSIV